MKKNLLMLIVCVFSMTSFYACKKSSPNKNDRRADISPKADPVAVSIDDDEKIIITEYVVCDENSAIEKCAESVQHMKDLRALNAEMRKSIETKDREKGELTDRIVELQLQNDELKNDRAMLVADLANPDVAYKNLIERAAAKTRLENSRVNGYQEFATRFYNLWEPLGMAYARAYGRLTVYVNLKNSENFNIAYDKANDQWNRYFSSISRVRTHSGAAQAALAEYESLRSLHADIIIDNPLSNEEITKVKTYADAEFVKTYDRDLNREKMSALVIAERDRHIAELVAAKEEAEKQEASVETPAE